MSRVMYIVLALVSLVPLAACNGARDTALQVGAAPDGTGFITKTLVRETRSRQYTLFVPRNYTTAQKWPLIIFLHGIGEAGAGTQSPLRVGLAPFAADHVDDFPFLVLFPQSTGGWDENSSAAADVIAALEEVERAYAVDPDRIILTGLSTGGYGTFAIGAKYSHLFAALVPMCPSASDTKDGPILAKMNLWCIENAVDPFVAAGSMSSTLSAIREAGGNPQHTVYPAVGHDCWERAYREGQLFQWMLVQRRGVATPPNASVAAAPAKSPNTNGQVNKSPTAVPVPKSATPVAVPIY